MGARPPAPAHISLLTGDRAQAQRAAAGGVRGVSFLHWPGLAPSLRGTVSDDVVAVADWLPTLGAASVASLLAAILTEIYLWNVCSCHEILRRNGLGQWRVSLGCRWKAIASGTASTASTSGRP
jgi:hypothetical protein